MERIQQLQRAAYRRCMLIKCIDSLLICSALTLAGAVILRALEQLHIFAPIAWREQWGWGVALALASALALTIITRPDKTRLARQIDDAAGLPQSVSTANWLASATSEWAHAVRHQAERAVAGLRVREIFPLHWRRRWTGLPIAALAFAIVWLMPAYNLPAALMTEDQREQQAKQGAVEQAEVEVAKIEEEIASLEDGLGQELEDLLDEAEQEQDRAEASTPEDVRTRAIQKMAKVGQELDKQAQQNKEIQQLSEMRKRMAQLRDSTSNDSPLKELTRAMQRGDFQGASEALSKLEKSMQNMSQEQQEALAAEMKNLAEQLEKLAQDSKALEETLANAGVDPSLANDLEALKKALEQMQGLTQEQREQLMQMAQQNAEACKQCQAMGQCMMNMQATMCQGGNCSGMMANLNGEFAKLANAQMQANQLNMMQAKLALSMQKLGASQGMCNSFGNNPGGTKGSPFGSGNSEMDALPDDAVAADPQKSPSIDDGSTLVIGRSLIDAGQVRGESRATFQSVMLAGGQAASRAMEDKQFPREYHDAVQSYFSSTFQTEQADDQERTDAPGS